MSFLHCNIKNTLVAAYTSRDKWLYNSTVSTDLHIRESGLGRNNTILILENTSYVYDYPATVCTF